MTTPFPFSAGAVLTAAQLNAITTLPINDQTASYTLVVGDAGKRVIMNNAGATTITVNNSVFGVGDTIFIANKGAGTTTITAGAGVTINTSGSLALAQYGGGTLVALSASTFTFFPSGGIGYGTATGGSSSSITVGGVNYTLLQFTSSSTLTVTKAGLFDVLVVGGGAGGFASSGTFYTGGGGGGWSQSTLYIDANQTITIGAGGPTTTSDTGGTSSIGSLFVVGGGGNCDSVLDTSICGASNGGVRNPPGTTKNYVPGHGTGGAGVYRAGCGAGGISTSDTVGGPGKDVSGFIGGSTLYKSVGGVANSATAGGANTGDGGGATNAPASANGGSGIIYVRFKV